ncbi:MAG: DNA polymerase Y family protein [Pseudomonadota bacterium]
MLWLAVHLPLLSLESLAALLPPCQAAGPVALVAQHRIVAANAAAQSRGVVPGMKRATALALAADLHLGAADQTRDAEALLRVAHSLLAYTPTVVLAPPDTVVIELQASLRCFGGVARLWRRLAGTLASLGYRVQRGHAPSALAAELLARWRDDPEPPGLLTRTPLRPGPDATSPDPAWQALPGRLGELPASWLAHDATVLAQLEAIGLRTLADLQRQPRAGLARRFGVGMLAALDQAWGRAPDPRQPIEPPLEFHSEVDLWARADDAEALLSGASVLLGRLLAWAQARHARVQSFQLVLHHESRLRENSQGAAGAHLSTLEITLGEPTGDARHLQAVLRERLAREPLAAPVLSLGLVCDTPVLGPPPNGELFPSQAGQREGLSRLVERLQARFGPGAVQRPALQADHRPERATVLQPFGPAAAAPLPGPAPRMTRPAWLLPAPQPLHERDGGPWWQGRRLHLLAGPERIESGWWDMGRASEGHEAAGLRGRARHPAEGDIAAWEQPGTGRHHETPGPRSAAHPARGCTAAWERPGAGRDYFVAQAEGGPLLWVFRLRPAPPAGEPGWFLHGCFG